MKSTIFAAATEGGALKTHSKTRLADCFDESIEVVTECPERWVSG